MAMTGEHPAAALLAPAPAIVPAHTPRRCTSPSSSTESFNTTNSSYSLPLATRLGKLSLQPKIQRSKQLAKSANCRIRRLLCGFGVETEDDAPLIELSSLARSRSSLQQEIGCDQTLLYDNAKENDDTHYPSTCKASVCAPSNPMGMLRKSNSTSTVNALNIDAEQRARVNERPSSIYVRSCSAVAAKRLNILSIDHLRNQACVDPPKPSPATTESQRRLVSELEDHVRYVTVYPSGEHFASEPLGSLIKAIYGIIKNPTQSDAEARGKAIKLRLKVTIHPDDCNKTTTTPDTPKSITSGSSNKAVAERGHRWSRPTLTPTSTSAHRTSLPNGCRASRSRQMTKKCRHHSSICKRARTSNGVARRISATDSTDNVQHVMGMEVTTPASWLAEVPATRRRHRHTSQRKGKYDVVLENHGWRDAKLDEDRCRHSRDREHNRDMHNLRGNVQTVDRIQQVVDWLHKADNDFSAKWPETPLAVSGRVEQKSSLPVDVNVNGRQKTADGGYRHWPTAAQDVVRMTAEWEWQVRR